MKMPDTVFLLVVVAFLANAAITAVQAQAPSNRRLLSDGVTSTDALGRTLPMSTEAPLSKQPKYVGIFYFLWHGEAGGNNPLFDTTQILDGPTRPWGGVSAFHWVDNAPVGFGDIADWWYNGESAPDGRFNYVYEDRRRYVSNSTYP